MINKLK